MLVNLTMIPSLCQTDSGGGGHTHTIFVEHAIGSDRVRWRVALHHPLEARLLAPHVLHPPMAPHPSTPDVQARQVDSRAKPCPWRERATERVRERTEQKSGAVMSVEIFIR